MGNLTILKFISQRLAPNPAEIAACQPQANTKDLLGETDNQQHTQEKTDMEATVNEPIENPNEFPPEEKVAIEAIDILDNLKEDRWEDTEEGMRYYGREYDPVTDEWH